MAGGMGERLRPLTDNVPKPMVAVNGVPFLDYLIDSIVQAQIRRVVLLVGYKSEVIVDAYGEGIAGEVEIAYSAGAVEDETGRRVLNAYDMLDERFLLAYGDNYWPIELAGMAEVYRRTGARMLTTVFSNKNGTGEYGRENNVEVGADGFVRRYDKGRKSSGLNGVDIGYFIVDKGVLDRRMEGNVSFERDIVADMAVRGELAAYVTDNQYYYVTNTESLSEFGAAAAAEGFGHIRSCC